MTPALVVLVSPPCATAAAWSRVVPLLDDRGVPNVAVQLPSCLPESDLGDAGFLRSVLDECGEPVVLVGHSIGGLVLTEVGGHPMVKHLVYMDAAMWDVDEAWGTLLTGGVAEGWAACVRVRDAVTEFDTDAVTAYLLSRGWSADDAREFASGFRPQRHAASVLKLTVAAWRTVATTYISPNDSEMKSRLRDLFAARASAVIEMPGDHFPHWRRPDEIADIFARIARDVVSE
jgi:pimeloyl-ACP methyl ester carboxylesterase